MWYLLAILALSQLLQWAVTIKLLGRSDSFQSQIGAIWQELLEWTTKHAKFHKDLGQVVDKVLTDEKRIKNDHQRMAKVLEGLRILGRKHR